MAGAEKESRTEDATSRKRSKEFEKGVFAKSQDVGTVFILAGVFVVLAFMAKGKARELCVLAASVFSNLGDFDLTEQSALLVLSTEARALFQLVFPILGVCMAGAILGGGVQSGFKLTPKAFGWKLEKLNPVSGFKRVFGVKQTGMHFGIDLLKFIAMGAILWSVIKEIMRDPIFSVPTPTQHTAEFILRMFLLMLSRLLLAMAVIAAIDYIRQRHKTNEDLKMTKEEVKDERKQMEGNPETKKAQRRFALRMLRQSMLKAVPDADVVVTNPTHFAVALKYERGKDAAPVVLAKGRDHFAQKIKAVARESEVPMVEDRPAAQMLYKLGQVGMSIPHEMYQVVATILAHVYRTHRYHFHRLNQKRRQQALKAAHA